MRLFKILGIAAAAVIGLAIVAAIIVAILFDPNDYKDYVTRVVEERTGRDFRIDDDLELSFFPWLAIETGGVTLGNHANFGDEPFATIESLSARVRVWPLLRREVEIGTVVIDGVVLNLGRDSEGNTNWSDLVDRSAGAADSSASEGQSGGINRLAIEGISVRNGRVLWREDRDDVRFIVSDIELSTGNITESGPADFDLAMSVLDVSEQLRIETSIEAVGELADGGRLRDVDMEFSLLDRRGQPRAIGQLALDTIELDAGGPISIGSLNVQSRLTEPPFGPQEVEAELAWQGANIDTSTQTASVDGLRTRLGDVSANWQLAASGLDTSPQIAGSVAIPSVATPVLVDQLGLELPAGLDPESLGDVSATARFSADLGSRGVEISELVASVLGMEIRGNAEIDADSSFTAEFVVPSFRPNSALLDVASAYAPERIRLDAVDSVALFGALERSPGGDSTTLRDIELVLGPATINGDVTLEQGPAGASYSGSVRSSQVPGEFIAGLAADFLTDELGAAEIGTGSIDTEFRYDTAGDSASLTPFTLGAFGLSAAGNVDIANVSSAPVVTGRATLDAFDPRDFLRRFGQPIPATSDPTALRRATVAGRFVIDSQHGDFRELVVDLDDSHITGEFRVDDFADPSFSFNLAADRIDVDRYLPPASDEADAGERKAGDIELSNDALSALRLSGNASVDDLKIANLEFQRVGAELDIADGLANIDGARANLYGGSFDGALGVDTRSEQPTMRLSGTATNLSLEPLIEALTGASNLRGTGNFDIDLAGHGPTVTDNLRTAAGQMSFALRDGAMVGFNLGRTLCAAYNASQQLPGPASQPDVTSFELIQAAATVSDGIAASPELLARSSFMDITGGGRLSLADARMDYDMKATLTDSIAIDGCDTMDRHIGGSIPFTISGPLTDADIRPDLGELAEERVREELRERVQDRLEERLRDLL